MRAHVALLSLALLAADRDAPPSPPLDLGVTEETGTTLTQIEVTLSGPAEALAKVHASSFKLALGRHDVEPLLVDGSCGAPAGSDAATGETLPPPLPVRPTTWMLYFDEPHLTTTDRVRALELAREVLPRILGPGDRATILANGSSLVTIQPMTGDLATLLAALQRLEERPPDTSAYADVLRAMALRPPGPGRTGNAPGLSSAGMEERWVLLRDFSRLKTALGRLMDVEPSRAMLYFASAIRRTTSPLSSRPRRIAGGSPAAPVLEKHADGSRVEFEFETLVREAAAVGTRIYAVEPTLLRQTNSFTGSTSRGSQQQSTLQSLASQSGGRAFINGVTPERMVQGIREDQGCRWLLSFDPEKLPRDKPLEVFVRVAVSGVRVHTPAKFEIQSPQRRASARLMASFSLDPGTQSPLRSGLVPLAWKDGKYTALLQVTAPGIDLTTATWDMGASVTALGRVEAETSARTRVGGAGVPVTLERTVELNPGSFELIAVAREVTSDRVISSHTQGTWPDPEAGPAGVVQPVVLQPGASAFTRDGEVRKSGSLVHGKDDPLDAARPTALVALVCRSKMVKTALDVARVLHGVSNVDFPPLELDLGSERCGQVRDMIPPKTLGPGRYRYEIVVKEKGAEVARGEASFVVPER